MTGAKNQVQRWFLFPDSCHLTDVVTTCPTPGSCPRYDYVTLTLAPETARLVEETVSKTAARKGRGFDSLSLRFVVSPVAQRRGQLLYTEMIEGSSPSRTTDLVV